MISIEKQQITDILAEKPDISYEEIGERLGGISGIKVRYWCMKHGIQKPKGPWKRHTLHLSEETLRNYLEEGAQVSLEETAQKLGITRTYVMKLYRKYGIKHVGKTPELHKAMGVASEIARPDGSIILADAYKAAKRHKLASSIMYLAIRKLELKPLRQSDALFEHGIRQCNSCHRTKPVAEFYTEKRNRQGLTYRCKSCLKNK